MAEQHGLDYVNLSEVVIPPSVVELVPESVARENAILPLAEEDGELKVIVSDPFDFETFEKLRFILNRKIEIALAPREHPGGDQPPLRPDGRREPTRCSRSSPTRRSTSPRPRTRPAADEEVDESSAPIVRLVHLIITEAVQLRASDIHIEPFEDRIRVRYRIDGVLVERDSPPRRLLGALLSRIKILAKLDIAERRRTQDGRIKVTVGREGARPSGQRASPPTTASRS